MDTLGVRDWERWTCACRLVVSDPTRLDAAAAVVDEILDAVEEACSRFHDDSELMTLRTGWNDVSPLLGRLVQHGLDAAEESAGAVVPTLGTALNALGYGRNLFVLTPGTGQVRSVAKPLATAVPATDWHAVRVEHTDGHVRVFRPEGVQLDLGATAKAAAADLCAETVEQELGVGVLVSLGGDIATAGAAPLGDTADQPSGWTVTVQDLPEDAPQLVNIAPGAAVATSSAARRTWTGSDGAHHHHLLDPTTGRSVDGPWRTATVVAPDCVRANIAATGALVKGHDAKAWLMEQGWPARLVDRNGRVLRLNGFPDEPTENVA